MTTYITGDDEIITQCDHCQRFKGIGTGLIPPLAIFKVENLDVCSGCYSDHHTKKPTFTGYAAIRDKVE